MSAVLEKRKKVEAQLELIMKSITAAGDELEKLQEENHLEMAELISVIELSPAKATENAICLPLTSAPAASPIPFPFSITNVVQPRPPYVFILKVSNQNGPVGQIRIRPAPKFHPEFVQKLGEFCYKTPTTFSSNINKVIHHYYTNLDILKVEQLFLLLYSPSLDYSSYYQCLAGLIFQLWRLSIIHFG